MRAKAIASARGVVLFAIGLARIDTRLAIGKPRECKMAKNS